LICGIGWTPPVKYNACVRRFTVMMLNLPGQSPGQ